MQDAARRERQDAFRADVARLVQAMRHHLPTRDVEPGATALLEPVQHLASLLAADAPAAHLQEAALAVVDSYDWPPAGGRPSSRRMGGARSTLAPPRPVSALFGV